MGIDQDLVVHTIFIAYEIVVLISMGMVYE